MMASNKIDSYRVSDVHTHITRDRSGREQQQRAVRSVSVSSSSTAQLLDE